MRSGEPQARQCVAKVKTPAQRRSQVVQLVFKRGESCLATRPADVRVGLPSFGEALIPGGMQASNRVQLSRSSESLVGVLAHWLQQPIAGPPIPLVHLNQAHIHQTGEQAEHFLSPNSATQADLFSCLQAPAAAEYRQPLENDLLRWREHSVAPVERGPHRLMATRREPAAAHQQPKRVSSRSRICSTPSARTHAAANSIARGRPSSRAQMAASTGTLRGVTPKVDWTARARSTYSCAAGNRTSSSGGTMECRSRIASEGTGGRSA